MDSNEDFSLHDDSLFSYFLQGGQIRVEPRAKRTRPFLGQCAFLRLLF